jgi:uncharacterized damage-inducible protein DinB
MTLSQSLLPEFDQEMAGTRRVLERIADDKLPWRPHPKSWTMGDLATHLANLPGWTNATLDLTELDIAPVGAPPYKATPLGSRAAILDFFDKGVAKARDTLAAADDATFMADWTLLKGGTPLFTMPRLAVLRTFVLNHIIHHRGQFTVYLRQNELPVPGMYGPSADEPQ